MAITPAAPGSSGKTAPSRQEGTSSDSIATGAGIERETALPHPPPRKPLRPEPVGSPRSRLVDKGGPVLTESAVEGPAPVGNKENSPAEESSAGRLAGSSAQTIGEMDAKFARLLAEVHQNRPGDDLEI